MLPWGTKTKLQRISGDSGFVDSEDGRVRLSFRESPEETRRVYPVSFRLKARQMSDVQSDLLPSGGELDLELEVYNAAKGFTIDYATGTFAPTAS